MITKRANNAKDGFNFYSVECTCSAVAMGRSRKIQKCKACSKNKHKLIVHVRKRDEPIVERPGRRSPIESIANHPAKAILEIEAVRKENKELRKQNTKRVFKSSLNQHRVMVDKENLCRVSASVKTMDSTITAALKEGNAKEELHLWEIHGICGS